MRHFDNDALATFVAITECNSFTQAAEQLGKTQAAVSQILGRLEHRIGRKLIDRSKSRKMTLTPYGDVLLGYARRLLALEEEAIAAMDCGQESTRIRIGMPDDYVDAFGSLPLGKFSERYPHVQVEIHCDFSSRLEEALDNGTIDLAIITRDSKHHVGELLAKVAQVWCAPPDSFPEKEPTLSLALFAEPCRSRPSVLSSLQSLSRPHRIVCSSSHFPGVLATVRSTPALTVLPLPVVPTGWRVLRGGQGFPELPDLEIALVVPGEANLMARRLAQFVETHFRIPQSAIA